LSVLHGDKAKGEVVDMEVTTGRVDRTVAKVSTHSGDFMAVTDSDSD